MAHTPGGSEQWRGHWAAAQTDVAGAVACIPKGRTVFIGSGAAEPEALVAELVRSAGRFADNTIVHLLTLGAAPYVDQAYQEAFRHNAFFIGANVREAVHAGRADYTPVFLSQIPELMRRRRLPVDVALIQTTPPDRFGFVNLGVSVDIVLAAVENASLVLAQVNPQMPVVHGSGWLPTSAIDAWVHHPAELPTIAREAPDAAAREIGAYVASLVEDGATIQAGIGQIPDAVLAALGDKKDLGVWTEMMPDGVVDLVRAGNVTGRYCTLAPGKVAASFTFGSRETYEYIDGNPMFEFRPSDRINDPQRIARQHRMVAINAALQVDLTGQVCADSIGTRFYSGIGGQVDFIRGASMCPGGTPVIAMRSTARDGELSRIVATLDEGAGVVTSRGDVHYVVTEYGIADLHGRSIRERAMALASIAHPDFRAELISSAQARRYVFADQLVPRTSYDRRWEKHVHAKNGAELLLRLMRVTDEPKMSQLFYALSPTTVYRRWMSGVPRMPHRQLQRYVDLDDVDNVAIVAEWQPEDSESELVAVARYHVESDDRMAEAAFVVRDDWQGQGLGSALIAHLIDIARDHDVRGFTAQVLADNSAMLRVFHKCGFPVSTSLDGGVYELTIPFM
jgi:acyl-CoA hydrolase/GNAT superfamily N-acetyltransferase